ncbi:hypothetical protein [Bacillus sp. T33-2]|uniref:hypothetical protein n=1 Tax=Bacillus sp. T33-2 TaxID=2054168 RepID=UPI0015E07B16|nr:hypothetical protein [Bacillus sp. T33-2]
MDSGWIINYKDGTSVILSERKYKELDINSKGHLIVSEEHWFDITEAIRRNDWLEVLM